MAEQGDRFGWALAGADFNADGYSDLAVGVPYEDVGIFVDAGAVNALYGSSSGLWATGTPDQIWSQDTQDIEGVAEEGDRFGYALAAANFGGSSHTDLAVGVTFEDVGDALSTGAVNVIYGSSSGLSATLTPDQLWSQDTQDIEGVADTSDHFGTALAAANFGGSSHADLAIGVPNEDVGNFSEVGVVNVIYGSSSGLSATATPDQIWYQDSSNVEGVAEPFDDFGTSLAAANFGGSSHADLGIGVPHEDMALENDGAVNIIYGSSSGLSATATPDQIWYQDDPGVEDAAEADDTFGSALAAVK